MLLNGSTWKEGKTRLRTLEKSEEKEEPRQELWGRQRNWGHTATDTVRERSSNEWALDAALPRETKYIQWQLTVQVPDGFWQSIVEADIRSHGCDCTALRNLKKGKKEYYLDWLAGSTKKCFHICFIFVLYDLCNLSIFLCKGQCKNQVWNQSG